MSSMTTREGEIMGRGREKRERERERDIQTHSVVFSSLDVAVGVGGVWF